jgi:hypothetical protein
MSENSHDSGEPNSGRRMAVGLSESLFFQMVHNIEFTRLLKKD